MAPRRRLTVHYPRRPSLEQTIASSASLSGTRRFFAGQGLFVFADAKQGMGRAAGDVWLRPSAYRRMSSYLDLHRHASIAGIRLIWNEAADARLADDPLFDDFRGVLRDGKGRHVGDKKIEVQSVCELTGTAWALKAVLTYEHFTTLAGGERLLDEGRVVVYARRHGDAAVDLTFVMQRQEDFEVVRQWIGASNTGSRWLARPVALPRENPSRQESLECLLRAIRAGTLFAVGHPDIYRGSAKPTHESAFVNVYKRASYETELTPIEPVVERMEADGGIIGALAAYAHDAALNEVVSLRIQQRPNDDHLRITWQPSKVLGDELVEQLTQAKWAELRPLDWSDERKHECLLATWAEAVVAIEPPTELELAVGA